MTLLESSDIPLGTPCPDFNLEGVGLGDFEGKKFLVVVFMCNHCPYVQAIWDKLVDLHDKYAEKGVQFVGINPNNNPEYPEESREKMDEYAKRYGMNFPYLFDTDQKVAGAFGAVCTPDIFVYDEKRKLIYHGRVDDIEAYLGGEEDGGGGAHPSMGCSIKWL